MTSIQMVCMVFVSTLPTNQSSMVAAKAVRMIFWVILAKYLEIILSLCDLVFDDIINFNRDWVISVKRTIVFGLASWAFEFSFLCQPHICILHVFNHFSSDTLSACSLSATKHYDRLSLVGVEPVLTIEAVQFCWHIYYLI